MQAYEMARRGGTVDPGRHAPRRRHDLLPGFALAASDKRICSSLYGGTQGLRDFPSDRRARRGRQARPRSDGHPPASPGRSERGDPRARGRRGDPVGVGVKTPTRFPALRDRGVREMTSEASQDQRQETVPVIVVDCDVHPVPRSVDEFHRALPGAVPEPRTSPRTRRTSRSASFSTPRFRNLGPRERHGWALAATRPRPRAAARAAIRLPRPPALRRSTAPTTASSSALLPSRTLGSGVRLPPMPRR